MRLNRSTLLLLVASVIIIIGALFLLSQPASSPENGAEATSTAVSSGPLFPELTADAISRFSARDNVAETQIVLDETGDGWVITESVIPPRGDVNQDDVVQQLADLAQLQYSDRFESDELASFGLDAPDYTITVARGEDTTQTINVGRLNPAGTRYYVQLEGDPAIYLVNVAGINPFTAWINFPPVLTPPTPTLEPSLNLPGPLFPEAFAFDVRLIRLADNESGAETILVRGEDSLWRIGDPPGTEPEATPEAEATAEPSAEAPRADQAIAELAAQGIASLTAVDAIEGANLEALGLTDPAYTLSFETADRAYTITVGSMDPSGTRYYAQVEGFPDTVAVIEQDAVEPLLELIDAPPNAPEPEATAEAETTAEVTPEATEAP